MCTKCISVFVKIWGGACEPTCLRSTPEDSNSGSLLKR